MTIKRFAALTLGLGLIAGGASTTIKANTDVSVTLNGIHNHRIQLHSTDNSALFMQIYNEIITSKEFNEQARKSLAKMNIGVFEKYLTQKLKKFQLSDKALNEIKKYLLSAVIPEFPSRPGKGPKACWPPF